jgi:murein DD-endopeptidase MepM/ murein hydrolase activator NlpD
MPWLTDALGDVGRQLSSLGGKMSPDVLRQVNQATTPQQLVGAQTGLGANPGQFTAQSAPSSAPAMGAMQFNATAPSQFGNDLGAGQFFAGNVTPPNMGGSSVGGFLAKDMGDHPWQLNSARPPGGVGARVGLGGGSTSIAGGQWATLDSMNGFIDQAASSTGVPANLIKAMLAREGSFGQDKYTVRLRGDDLYAFNGMFRKTAESRGIDFDRMLTDDGYAVWAMGETLRQIQQETGLTNWDDVAGYYFAGPNYTNPNWGDETGVNTVWNYKYGPTGVVTRWHELDAMAGVTPGGSIGGNGDWSSFIPGGQSYDWGEFGVDSDNGYYGYGTQYGLNGRQHTGVDITGPWNSQYRSPVSGTVTCAGTGVGAGADGGGCAAFGTMDGRGGAGRIEVQLDNGAVLIFGHSQQSFVRPGQRINVGDALGTIGWANSDHVHLEARVRDPSTPSGWRIVDPRTVLGGGGGFGGGGFASASPFVGRGSSFIDFLLG